MINIYQILEDLASSNSRKHKEKILEENKDNSLFTDVLVAAMDPRVMYYMDKVPEAGLPSSSTIGLRQALDQLDELSDRNVTGNAAQDFVANLKGRLSEENQTVIDRIIKKDLRCGIGAKTINKVIPNLIYTHPYMRCSGMDAMKNISLPAIVQQKADGLYIDVVVDPSGHVRYMTRQGQQLNINNSTLDRCYSQYRGQVFMGEGLIRDTLKTGHVFLPREKGNGVFNSITELAEKPHLIYFKHWDVVPYEDWLRRDCALPYSGRYAALTQAIEKLRVQSGNRIDVVDSRKINDLQEAVDYFLFMLRQGEEGAVLKDWNGIWKDGTSKQQIKLKVQCDVELEVYEVAEGDKGKQNEGKLGRLRCRSSDGVVDVSVGSGYKKKQREEIWEARKEWVGKVVTVRFNDLMKTDDGYSLFLPRFIEERFDKDEADSYDRVREQFEDAKKLVAKL